MQGQVAEQVEYDTKYAGYIERDQVRIEKQKRLSEKRIPDKIDYSAITHLRAEAKEKLERIRPASLGQASRISGITPADIALLLVHLENSRPT